MRKMILGIFDTGTKKYESPAIGITDYYDDETEMNTVSGDADGTRNGYGEFIGI